MASRRIESFEHRFKVLRRTAHKYISWRFELDEIVNQMWISKAVRRAEYEHQLVRAAKNAFWDYLRSQLGRTVNKQAQQLTNEPILEDTIEDSDAWMDFDSITKGYTFTQRIIVKLRADWFTWPEVAKLTGLSETNARYKLSTVDKEPIERWAAV